jgi:DNA primase large subunit
MNCKDIRSYWEDKYLKKFKLPYYSPKVIMELTLLKKLIKAYNEYIVLEAIDSFFSGSKTVEKVTIPYFATPKVFKDINKDILLLKDVAKYFRYLKDNKVERKKRKKIEELLHEYIDYKTAMVLFDYEKSRLPEIISELEGEVNATGI